MYLEFNPTRYINKDNWKHIMKYSPQSDVHRTEGRKLFSRKNNMLTNHDSNRNRNMSRTDEGKESETNEDKQKNEVRDAFTTHGTSYYGLEFQANNSNYASPIVYVDSDWGGDHMDRKSISGFAVLLDGGAISWGSKKQTSVLLSTIETEFIAISTAVKEILWHQSLFSSLDMALTSPTSLLIDNQGALDLIKSGQINDCTKHIDIKFRHVCDQEDQETISS